MSGLERFGRLGWRELLRLLRLRAARFAQNDEFFCDRSEEGYEDDYGDGNGGEDEIRATTEAVRTTASWKRLSAVAGRHAVEEEVLSADAHSGDERPCWPGRSGVRRRRGG